MVHILRALAALALTLLGGGAFAQVAASDGAFDKFYAQVTGIGKQTVNFGSNGQLVVGQGVPQISTAGGPVLVDRSVPILNNSGSPINTNARISVPPAVLGKIIRGGIAAIPVIGTGVALYDLAKEVGFTINPDKSVIKDEATESKSGVRYGGYGQCAAPIDNCRQIAGSQSWSLAPDGYSYCNVGGGIFYPHACSYGATVPSSPSDLQALEDAIATKSGWPASSHVSRAVAEATALKPAPSFPATPQVTGPASSPGTVKSKQNPDGSSEVKTTTHNHTYQGNTVNTTTTTVTSVCNGGSCNTTTETEEPKLDEQPFAMPCGVPGTPPCAVKVDDSGMPPDGGNALKQETGDIDPQKTTVLDKLGEIDEWELGDWTWTFQLPTGCTPLPMFLGVEVNPCQWQAEVHDVMTVIWLLTGITGCFVIFSRAFQ